MNKWYESSTGARELSLTIKGILVGAIPLIIFVGQQFDVQITQEYLFQGIQLFTELVSASIIAVGLGRKMILWAYGLARK